MGILTKLGLTTDDEKPVEKKEEVKEISKPYPQQFTQPSQNVFSTSTPIDDSKYVELFSNSINDFSKRNPKFDLKKFQSILNTLSATIPDEKSRYAAAFASASVMNSDLSLTDLISSANDFLEIISKEQSGFDDAISSVIVSEIESKKIRLAKIDERKKEIVSTIESLNAETSKLVQEEIQLNSEIAGKSAEIDSKKISFASARTKIENSINLIATNLKTYIGK